jgi:hypothetical protein
MYVGSQHLPASMDRGHDTITFTRPSNAQNIYTTKMQSAEPKMKCLCSRCTRLHLLKHKITDTLHCQHIPGTLPYPALKTCTHAQQNRCVR